MAAALLLCALVGVGCDRATCPVQDRGTTEIIGNVSLSSQSDVDAMAGIRRIDGNLSLSGGSMDNLEGLKDLRVVTGALRIWHAWNLEDLWDLESLEQVSELEINACERLRSLTNLGGITACEKISISDCDSLGYLGYYEIWSKATSITLRQLPALTSIKPLRAATSLRYLTLDDLGEQVDIDDVADLPTIINLQVEDLGLEHVPDLSLMTGLESLRLSRLPSLVRAAGAGRAPQLEELSIVDCPALESLSALGITDNLRDLQLIRLPALTSLEGMGDLSALKSFYVSDAGVSSLEPLRGAIDLRNLTLTRVPVTDYSPLTSMPLLGSLRLWGIDGLVDLRSLPAGFDFSTVTLTRCPDLVSVEGLRLADNANLTVDNCPAMTTLSGLGGSDVLYRLALLGAGPSSVDPGGIVQVRDLQISETRLTDLSFMAMFETVNEVRIYRNSLLVDAGALEGLAIDTVAINNNHALDQCVLEGMNDGWALSQAVEIQNNGPCLP